MNIPRIRARVGLCEEGEHKGKWFFEVSLWDLGGENQIGDNITLGPWESEKIAHVEMKKAVQIASEAVEKNAGFKPSGKYLDLKAGGVLRPWQEN